MIAELLEEPPPPSPEVTAAAARRLADRIGSGDPRFRWNRLARPAVIAGAVGVAAALAVVTLVPRAAPAGHGHSAGGQAGNLTGPQARHYILALASTAGLEPAGGGRYWHETLIEGTRVQVGPPGGRYGVLERWLSEDWTRPRRPGWHAGYDQPLGARPETSADAAAWRRDGSPSSWPGARSGGEPVRRDPSPPIFHNYDKHEQEPWGSNSNLPADPVRLKKILLAHLIPVTGSAARDLELYQTAIPLLRAPIGPALRSAVFRVIAGIPLVQVRLNVRDPGGRPGTALIVTMPGNPAEVDRDIIDPATGRLLAYENIAARRTAGAGPGTLLDYVLFRQLGWTSKAPPRN
jgi:hypothetical protein